jgi:hypothetical protein
VGRVGAAGVGAVGVRVGVVVVDVDAVDGAAVGDVSVTENAASREVSSACTTGVRITAASFVDPVPLSRSCQSIALRSRSQRG